MFIRFVCCYWIIFKNLWCGMFGNLDFGIKGMFLRFLIDWLFCLLIFFWIDLVLNFVINCCCIEWFVKYCINFLCLGWGCVFLIKVILLIFNIVFLIG